MPHLFLTHSIVGSSALVNFDFHADRDHTFCRICGTIFQAQITKSEEYDTPANLLFAYIERREWSHKHSLTHSASQHSSLEKSGRFLTPEAAHRLAAYGIAPVQDMVFDQEYVEAAIQAPRAPDKEVETTLKGGISI